jgi:hypothetical protein
MSANTLFLILAGLIGLFVGLLFASLFSGKESRSAKQKLPPEDMLKQGFADEARLWYSPAGKKLVVEMDGDYYRESKALSQEQKKKIQRLLGLCQGWVEPVPPPDEPVKAPDPIPVQKSPFAYEHRDEVVEPSPQVEEDDFMGNLQFLMEESPASPFTEAVEPKIDDVHKLSITEQISEILDELIAKTDVQEKNIKLIENADHGVDVFVGLEKFPGVDAVPYPQVRELIRTAVQLWEKEAEAQQRAKQ